MGQKKSFSMGFHMVKCRGQQSLNENESVQKGLKDEEEFFKK